MVIPNMMVGGAGLYAMEVGRVQTGEVLSERVIYREYQTWHLVTAQYADRHALCRSVGRLVK